MALLGIDVGTSACKVALFNPDGTVRAQASEAYPVVHPQPGWAQQDPEVWWRAVASAIRTIGEDEDLRSVDGIGIAGQSWSAILIDADGNVLADTPIWMDTRAQSECDEMRRVVGATRLFAVSGNPTMPAYTLPKILWYRHHLPDAYARAAAVLQSNAFIAYRLTGTLSTDLSQGYGLQCFDMRLGAWDTGILRKLGRRESLLPPLVGCSDIIGTITDAVAAQTGLLQGVPVVAGGLDAACGSLGAGVYDPGQTQEQGGQAGGMSICLDHYAADERLILSRHVVPDRFLLQGGTVGGGGALRWLRAQVCPELSFEAMSELAATVSPGSDGLVFLPYMAGERSPIWNPDVKGAFYGLDFTKTRAHLIRACMEGVAYALRHNLDVAAEAGAAAGVLHAMGGAADSLVWAQIKADITGHTMTVPAAATATTLGAALLAGIGVGVYRDAGDAVRRTVRFMRTQHPNPAYADAYEFGYDHYLRLSKYQTNCLNDSPKT